MGTFTFKDSRSLVTTLPNHGFTLTISVFSHRLGETTVKTLVSSGLLKGLPDIYDLPARKPELVKLPGWGEKKADNLINAVLNSSHKDFGSFLFAVGIPHMGKNAARLLADRYPTVAALVSTSEEELKGIQGFGDVLSHSVHTFLQDPKSRDMLLRYERGLFFFPFCFLFQGEVS